LAFIARFDKDVGSLFQEVWDEGGQAARLGNVSFGSRLEETIIPYLSRSIIQSLEDVSWNRRKTACAALIELCDTNILSPPPRATGENKETVTPERTQRFVVRAESSCKILGACVKSIVTTRIWRGKEDLLKAVAKIAGNWISSNIDAYALLRDREQGDSDIVFPMNPVNLEKESKDLFLGDAWFSKDHEKDAVEEMDVTEENSSAVLLISDADDESNINFSAGDSLLATDDVEDLLIKMRAIQNQRSRCLSMGFAGYCWNKGSHQKQFPSQMQIISATEPLP